VARQLGSIGTGECTVCFLSTVGDDEPGRFFMRTLVAEGAVADPQSTIRVLPATSQSTCVVLSGPSDRAMVTCYASVHKLEIGQFAKDTCLTRASIVHLSGYFNCVGLHSDQLLTVVEACRAHGALIALDPQYDCTEKWTGTDGHLGRLLRLVDVFLPNEVEASGITGAATPEEALEQLSAEFPAMLIIISVGADGAIAARGRERWSRAALEAPFNDATGAGDAFDAGCLLALLRAPNDVDAVLHAGVTAGAIAVGEAGACERPIPRECFEAILRDGSERLAIAE